MKILKPCEDDSKKFSSLTEDYMKNAIFLVGPCPRKNHEKKTMFGEKKHIQFLKISALMVIS